MRLDLSYDGAGFRGWATQPGLRTVQETLEAAIGTVLRLPEPPRVTCAGRTDAGVHARGQVVHVDLPADHEGVAVDPVTLARRLRRLLPDDVVVRDASVAPEGFDARFAAIERRYAYRIQDDPAALDPLARGHVVAWPRRLDVDAMAAAGALLVGEHDFAAFCRRREGATTIRRLVELAPARLSPDATSPRFVHSSPVSDEETGDECTGRSEGGLIVTTVRADAFCHSMVRALMGALVAVGEGRREPAWAREVMLGGERDAGVRVMPAHGLVLEEVVYPPDEALADRARAARSRRDA